MKQLVVLSGKGGTGKTTITSSFAALQKKSVVVDADVDAADLHLVLNPEIEKTTQFFAGKKAVIDHGKCIQCGTCEENCRFDAILNHDDVYTVDALSCEGCGLCARLCDVEAITMNDENCGEWYESKTAYGKMFHAKLGIAADNSGKLVSLVRERAKEFAEQNNEELVIIDGPPGVGCPVIASVTGSDLVVTITEPSLSGLHDLERLAVLLEHFKIKQMVVINKADLESNLAEKIKTFCIEKNIEIAGEIPFDKNVVKAMIKGKPLVELYKDKSAQSIIEIWEKVKKALAENN